MPRYIDVEGYRKLFDEEYKKTRNLIIEGETHLDNLAEGFSEASRVIDRMPTADVVPRSELEAALADLKRFSNCSACKHYTNSIVKPCAIDGCCVDGKEDKWEWRGIQKEEGVEKRGFDKSD
jgi:hypothetical protein